MTVIILILTAGCSSIPTSTTTKLITQKHSLNRFKSVILSGNTTVELVNGQYATNITGSGKDLYSCHTDIRDQVLYINAKSSVAIKLIVPGLKNITVTDNATLNAKDFITNNLTIIAKNNGTINLEGQFNIDKIYQRGNGRINITWVSSNKLFIDSNSGGPIYLAGIANNIVAKLTHNAQLDVRYLRTQKASVFTTDKAKADILVLDTLEAFAVDNSNIYYYKRPHYLTVVTRNSGNVLHPDWIR